jgi:hypothetical protein
VVCDAVAPEPAFYQRNAALTGRKVQYRYEELDKTFESMYLNPGRNGSNKQVLTPL